MYLREIIVIAVFIVFWLTVFCLEARYIYCFFKNKIPPVSGLAVVIHILVILCITSFLYGHFIEPYRLDLQYINIITDKFKNTGLTVIQISDLHCDKRIGNERKLSTIINEIHPDIIVFTGDTINTPRALPLFKKTMSQLKAKMGKYAVKGNVDVWYWKGMDLFGGTGFIELNGRTESLSKNSEKFTISGLSIKGYRRNLSFLSGLPQGSYNILLFHYPGINEEIGKNEVDLFLSGHTHGGQLALPFYGALITFSEYGKKYESGRYDLDGKVLYVNRGIGMDKGFVPKIRFLSRPEITVFHILPDKKFTPLENH